MAESNWILTDDDTMQHVRHLTERRYEIIDSAHFPDGRGFVCQRVIDLNDYEMDEEFNNTYLKPYDYEDEAAVRALYGAGADQIIVECIAETEIWERHNEVFAGTFKACLAHIRAIVKPKVRRVK